MISLYLPGSSLLHRMRAGAKLLLLCAISFALMLLPVQPWSLAALAGTLTLWALAGRMSPARLVRALRGIWVLIAFMVLLQLVFLTPLDAAVNTTRVVTVIAIATIVTATTSTRAIIDVFEWILAPLRRVGARPERIGLAFALALAAIPQLLGFVQQVQLAARARGVRVMPWRVAVPVLVLSLKHADDVAEALAARGLE